MKAALAAPVIVAGRIAGAAKADLKDLVIDQEVVIERPPKRSAVGDLLAEHGIAGIGMGVHLNKGHRPVLLRDRAQDRVGEGVIAAEGERHDVMGQDVFIG